MIHGLRENCARRDAPARIIVSSSAPIRRRLGIREELCRIEVSVAQQVTVQLVDDIDGSEAETSVEFGLDGVGFTIDLSAENADELREVLAPYVDSARRVSGRRRVAAKAVTASAKVAPAPPGSERERNQSIRDWAREKGWQVSERGRIPSDVAEAFDKAHRQRGRRR
jgi:hypothetical protein